MNNQNNNGSTKGVAGDRVSVGVWKKVFDRDGTEVKYASGKFRLGDLLDIANGDPDVQILLSYFPATTKKNDRSPDANVQLKVFVPRDNNGGGGGGWNNAPKQGQRTQQAPQTNGGGGYRKPSGGGQGGGTATQTRTRQQVPTQQAQAQYDDDNGGGGDDQQAGNSAPW